MGITVAWLFSTIMPKGNNRLSHRTTQSTLKDPLKINGRVAEMSSLLKGVFQKTPVTTCQCSFVAELQRVSNEFFAPLLLDITSMTTSLPGYGPIGAILPHRAIINTLT